MFELLSHPRVRCFASDRLDSMEAAVADVARLNADPVQLAVCLKDQDVMIGLMFAANDEPDTYSLGWHLNTSYEGKGYASEAARAFIDILFTHKGARRIYAYVEDDNIRSQKLCERLGMRMKGFFIEFISFVSNADGTPKYENTCLYASAEKGMGKQPIAGAGAYADFEGCGCCQAYSSSVYAPCQTIFL